MAIPARTAPMTVVNIHMRMRVLGSTDCVSDRGADLDREHLEIAFGGDVCPGAVC
jgi:hypothetical protein